MSIHVPLVADGKPDGRRSDDPLVVDSLSPGDRLLLLGPSMAPVERVARGLLAANEDEVGVVVVSTRELFSDARPTDADRATVADRQRGAVNGRSNAPNARRTGHVPDRRVAFSTELTGTEIAVTRRLADLRRRGVERPWLVVDTLSPLFGPLDSSTLVRFCHSLAGTVDHHGGIGCFVANRDESRADHLERLKHLSDGALEVRTAGSGHEVRRRGFDGRDPGWHAIGSDAPDEPGRSRLEAD